jgi:Ca2+-binding RTX toxin-like protein
VEDPFDVESLSLMGDGRIVVHHSGGLNIVDPRQEAVSLQGTAGNDHFIGTAFDDTFSGSAGADRLNGGAGTDIVSFANATTGVTANLSGGSRGDAAGDVYTGIEGLVGSSFDDVFTGSGTAILQGRNGNDIFYVQGRDSVREAAGEGRDTVVASGSFALDADAHVEVMQLAGLTSKNSANLTGSNSANEITGHAGANLLKGLGGNDVINASSGNDELHGGLGNDQLRGGTGKDVFVFDTKLNKRTNADRIYDFKSKDDTFHLDNKVFTKLGSGTASKPKKFNSDMFVNGKKAQDREDRVVYDKKTGALYYDADGTGSKAQVKIATLTNKAKLSWHDFFVI